MFPYLQEVKNLVETELGTKVAFWRSDNGTGEFGVTYQNWLKQQGIQHEPCPPYEKWMNGVVERATQEINKIATSISSEANLPIEAWCIAVEHAFWIRNRLPTSALPYGPPNDSPVGRHITPFGAWKDKPPNVSRVKVFGCKAIVKYPSELHRSKFSPAIIEKEGLWIGLTSTHIAKILDPQTHTVLLRSILKMRNQM